MIAIAAIAFLIWWLASRRKKPGSTANRTLGEGAASTADLAKAAASALVRTDDADELSEVEARLAALKAGEDWS